MKIFDLQSDGLDKSRSDPAHERTSFGSKLIAAASTSAADDPDLTVFATDRIGELPTTMAGPLFDPKLRYLDGDAYGLRIGDVGRGIDASSSSDTFPNAQTDRGADYPGGMSSDHGLSGQATATGNVWFSVDGAARGHDTALTFVGAFAGQGPNLLRWGDTRFGIIGWEGQTGDFGNNMHFVGPPVHHDVMDDDASDTVNGTSGDDLLNGTNGDDSISGFGGDDTINGLGGSDVIDGGSGNDTIDGGSSKDSVNGGAGDDVLRVTGGSFGDDMDGGSGDDTLDLDGWTNAAIAWNVDLAAETYEFLPNGFGTNGSYTIVRVENVIGSDYNDSITGDSGANMLDGGYGDDTIKGGGGNDHLVGNNGDDIINGGGGDDSIDAGSGDDVINGGNGNDSIEGGFGIDTINGGSGDDTINGLSGKDSVNGGSGNDVLRVTGGDFGDDMDGGNGIDTLDLGGWTNAAIGWDVNLAAGTYAYAPNGFGVNGSHTITNVENVVGSYFDDHILGDGGDNVLIGGAGHDLIYGGAGDDLLDGSDGSGEFVAGQDTVLGGAGNDIITYSMKATGSATSGTYDGGAGTDMFFVSHSNIGADRTVNLATGEFLYTTEKRGVLISIENVMVANATSVIGDNGDNLIIGDGNFDNLFEGGGGADTITGGGGADTIAGGGGNDEITGGTGGDDLTGGGGDDVISGGNGNDDLYGNVGADDLSGGGGKDRLFGGNGGDAMSGGDGDDTMNGGSGRDTIDGGVGRDIINGGNGDDIIEGNTGNDELDGGDGIDMLSYINSGSGVTVDLALGTTSGGHATGDTITNFENLQGSANGDVLGGDNQDNVIYGLNGSDSISAGGGDDVIYGGSDNDLITGGNGRDTLAGGDGFDDYVFAKGFGNDTITDFSAHNAEDIDLSGVSAITGFNDLLNNHLNNVGGFAQIHVGSNTILLASVAFADVGIGAAYSADDFIF